MIFRIFWRMNIALKIIWNKNDFSQLQGLLFNPQLGEMYTLHSQGQFDWNSILVLQFLIPCRYPLHHPHFIQRNAKIYYINVYKTNYISMVNIFGHLVFHFAWLWEKNVSFYFEHLRLSQTFNWSLFAHTNISSDTETINVL